MEGPFRIGGKGMAKGIFNGLVVGEGVELHDTRGTRCGVVLKVVAGLEIDGATIPAVIVGE